MIFIISIFPNKKTSAEFIPVFGTEYSEVLTNPLSFSLEWFKGQIQCGT
jgi:hypothetical protein